MPMPGNGTAETGLTVGESGEKRIRMSANIGAINLNSTKTAKGDFCELQIDGAYIAGDEGEPQLPALRKLVQIPHGAEFSVNITRADTMFYSLADYNVNAKIAPRQSSQSKSGGEQRFKYKKRSYRRNYFAEQKLVTVTKVGTMRGIDICQVAVNPVRYNPKTNTVMVLNNIDFEIDFEGGAAKSAKNEASPYFEDVYSALGNHKSGESDLTKYPVKYLIVTDTAFLGALADFISWKRQKGFEVIVATTDTLGSTAAAIKSWVAAQYASATADSPAPSFLLLAADTDKIPTSKKGESTGYGTDLYYACMDGDDDIIPDLYYGRFSARTAAQMKAIADKTIIYEKYQFDDPSYLAKATLIAGEDSRYNSEVGIPTVNYITKNRINAKNGYNTINKFTTKYTNCYADTTVSVGLMTYTAHGETTSWVDPELTQSRVRAFTNDGKFPFVVANCCLSGQITKDECLGETWLRKPNSGAVAYIGSSPKTYWQEDFYWAVGAHSYKSSVCPDTSATTTGAFDAPFVSKFVCGDAMLFAGNLAVTEAYDNNYYNNKKGCRYYWEGYNYLGDPSLLVYFGEGRDNQVRHDIYIPFGANSLKVEAESGSYIAVSQGDTLLGAALVPDGETEVTVSLKKLSQSQINIVVTKSRCKHYIGTITAITPDEPYITLDEVQTDGPMAAGSTRNLSFVLNNIGTQTLNNPTVSVSSSSQYVTKLIKNDVGIGALDFLQSDTLPNICTIELSNSTPDQAEVIIDVKIEGDGHIFNRQHKFRVAAPKMKLNPEVLISSEKKFMPGDSAEIVVTLANSGHATLGPSVARLIADNGQPMVTVLDDEQMVDSLTAGASVDCRFRIAASEYADLMSVFSFTVVAEAQNAPVADSCDYAITIGSLYDKVLGTSTSHTEWYPFNNYYKCGKTQILYTAADLGNAPSKIYEMALQVAYTIDPKKFEGYTNFKLKMMHTSISKVSGSAFTDMKDAQTVMSRNALIINGNGELNLSFDTPFVYDGKSNVIVEFSWGTNKNYVEKDERTKLYCMTTSSETVVYDFEDDMADIAPYAAKKYRPNTTFRYQKPKYLHFDVKDLQGNPIPDIELSVENQLYSTDSLGTADLLVFSNSSCREYVVNSIDYGVETERISVSGDTTFVSLQMRKQNVYTLVLHVVDSASCENLPNALVTFGGKTVMSDGSGNATFVYVTNNQHYYTVDADGYLAAMGRIDIGSDTLISVGMTKRPVVTFCFHNGKKPQPGVRITIADSVLVTDSLGVATYAPQLCDNIPYSIAITDELTLTDTIFGFKRPATIDIDFAFFVADTTHGGTPGGHGDDTTHHDTLIIEPVFYSLTFRLTDGREPIFEGKVTVNGIEKMTDSLGLVRFDSIAAETPISYIAKVTGYTTIDGQTEQTGSFVLMANTTINIALKAIELPPEPPISTTDDKATEIVVYPNPSDGLLQIQNCDGQEFMLFDMNGRKLKTGTVEGGRIDLRPITTGTYTLIIKREGRISSTQVVIY